MNDEKLYEFYEKLYFHELERREKLSARLNVPLAILVAVIGFLSFMLNNAPIVKDEPICIFFWLFFGLSCLATISGAWFFRASWFGHTDKLLPTANDIEAYRQKIYECYKEFDECDEWSKSEFKKYLSDSYKEFSSVNTVNNDRRAYQLYRATYSITVAVLLAFAAFIPYFLFIRKV